MLSKEELQTLSYQFVKIEDYCYFGGHQILEIPTRFFLVHDYQNFPTGGSRKKIRLYNKNGRFYLFDSESGTCVWVMSVDMIKSHVSEFDGFSFGKKFELKNGQIWEQIGYLNSPCSPGGKVWIKDRCVMRVGNWDFDVPVRRIK